MHNKRIEKRKKHPPRKQKIDSTKLFFLNFDFIKTGEKNLIKSFQLFGHHPPPKKLILNLFSLKIKFIKTGKKSIKNLTFFYPHLPNKIESSTPIKKFTYKIDLNIFIKCCSPPHLIKILFFLKFKLIKTGENRLKKIQRFNYY